MSYDIKIRTIDEADVYDKVKWYNDCDVTKFLHYTNEFTFEETLEWLKKITVDNSRDENIIQIKVGSKELNIGVIGLFDIDYVNKKAGFYITIGEKEYQGKGFAKRASIMFLKKCFEKYNLQKIYLYTDYDNVVAKQLYDSIGFTQEGLLRNEIYYQNKFISRYYFGILREEFDNKYS